MKKESSSEDRSDNNKLSAYAGRWVAKLWGRIVGQGGTPNQALQAAQSARHKETPQIDFIPTNSPLIFPEILNTIINALPKNKEIYLVGGAVRDSLLKKDSTDFDFVVPKDALKTARKVANVLEGAYYKMDDEFETGRVVLTNDDNQRTIIDFSVFRGPDLDSDLHKRDFTINAIAVDINNLQNLFDPCNGLSDLLQKRLAACSDTTFSDDSVRSIRAIRFAAKYGLKIENQTKEWMKQSIKDLSKISSERIRDEFYKLLQAPNPATSLQVLDMLGILEAFLPEIKSIKESENWNLTIQTIKQLEEILEILTEQFLNREEDTKSNLKSGVISLRLGRYRDQIQEHFYQSLNIERAYFPLLYLSAFLHTFDKNTAQRICSRLRFSNKEINRILKIIEHLNLPIALTDQNGPISNLTVYRYFKETGKAGIEISFLSLASIVAKQGSSIDQAKLIDHVDTIRLLLEGYFENYDQVIEPEPLINGNDLTKTIKMKPGPQIGKILEAVIEAQITGEISTKEEALSFARSFTP